jgi:hypothetical protein
MLPMLRAHETTVVAKIRKLLTPRRSGILDSGLATYDTFPSSSTTKKVFSKNVARKWACIGTGSFIGTRLPVSRATVIGGMLTCDHEHLAGVGIPRPCVKKCRPMGRFPS